MCKQKIFFKKKLKIFTFKTGTDCVTCNPILLRITNGLKSVLYILCKPCTPSIIGTLCCKRSFSYFDKCVKSPIEHFCDIYKTPER